ncbi:hypothetical protein KJ652_04430 [Patescibacteria group bacterium]|nr:hypothetical protein [Patescibacteria group bacterium]MBU1123813.1 hypothetical protein [Patescibacteria group bacterium]
MVDQPLGSVFGSVGVVYGLLVPLFIILLFAVFAIASLNNAGAKPKSVVKATYCYLMMGVGILLMTIAAIPTVSSVLANMSYASATYVGLLVVFAVGGSLFLFHDNMIRALDASSQVVPSLIYLYTIKIIGTLTAVLSGLSILLTLILGGAPEGWWVTPLTMFLYGFVLYVSTREEDLVIPSFFKCNLKLPKKSTAAVASKPAKTKKKGKKRRKKK